MRHSPLLYIVIIILAAGLNILDPEQALSGTDSLVLEDFQKYGAKPFPDWTFVDPYYEADAVYSIIEENGAKFLRGSTVKKNHMVQIGKQINQNNIVGKNKINWDINKFPYISWDWRVRILPSGGNESIDKVNDSAASLYVIFQRARIPLAGWQKQPANWIKYVWSSTLPVGTVVRKKYTRFGMTLYEGRYVVVASGSKDLGKWITFKRNVLADYIAYFGGNPAFNPIEIGILTDSNTTGSIAEADYDNIIVWPR